MQEARCEQLQPNGAWRVWLHPSGREVAVYSDEGEALDVTELVNLKIKIDAKIPIEGLTDLDAEQIEMVTNMPMEVLLQQVAPEAADSASDEIEQQLKLEQKDRGIEKYEFRNGGSYTSDSDDEDVGLPATLHGGGSRAYPNPWQKNADGSFSRVLKINEGMTKLYYLSLNDEVRNYLVGKDTTNVKFIQRDVHTGKEQLFDLCFVSTINDSDIRRRKERNKLYKGFRQMADALSLGNGDVVTLSKGPVDGQVYISVTHCSDGRNEEGYDNNGVDVASTAPPLTRQHRLRRNSDGSYSKALFTLNNLSIPSKVRQDIFGSLSTQLPMFCNSSAFVFITKSSVPELDNCRFKCEYSADSQISRTFQLNKGINKLFTFLKAKLGDTMTLSKGPAAGQAFITIEQPNAMHSWIKNSDGSYSKSVGEKNLNLNISQEVRRELMIHQQSDFFMITKSADPDVDGKRFPVGFPASQWSNSRGTVSRGFFSLARCLNLQPYDIITLSKGPNIGEVYISVAKESQSVRQAIRTTDEMPSRDVLGAADAHNGGLGFDVVQAPLQRHQMPPIPGINHHQQQQQQRQQRQQHNAVAESPSGSGVQKRQLPSPSSDLQVPPSPAKRQKTSTDPLSTLNIGQQQLHQSPVASDPVQAAQRAAERRSLPEMLALVKSIIEKEAVGLSAVDSMSYRTKFMIKMTPEVRVSSLQMLEELDGAGEHDGVKLCVQTSLQDLY